MFADIELSSESLAAVGMTVGTLWTALIMMWRDQTRRCQQHIRDLQRQRDALLRVLYRLDLADQVPSNVPHHALPPPPLSDDPD